MLRDMADGDTSYLDRVIGRFVADSPGVLDDLEAAVAGQDVDGVRHQAHRLAGNALNIGVPQVAELARLLEHIADEGTTDGAAEVLPRLGEALASGRTALVDYQRGHRSQV